MHRRSAPVVFAEPLEPRRLLHGDVADVHADWLINAGGPAYTNNVGQVFAADTNFVGGIASKSNLAIAQTVNDPLYAARRYGNFSYDLPVPAGTYSLKLYFAEPYWTAPGQRKFDVFAENAQLLDDFDIVALVGPRSAITRTYGVTVTDGALDVRFASVVDNAIVSAIEIHQTSAAPTPPVSTTISWATKANAPFKFAEGSAASVGGKFYALGGYDTTSPSWQATNKVSRYDPTTNTWDARAPMPLRLTHIGVASDDRFIYVAGGYITNSQGIQIFASKSAFKYDTQTNAWTSLPNLPLARGAGATVLVNRTLHFFGGVDLNRVDRTDHWTLNLDNVSAGWVTKAALPVRKNHLGAAVVNGKIYAVGGQIGTDDATGNQSSVYAFDPSTNTWTAVASLPKVRSHIGGATFAFDGKIVVAGGITAGGSFGQSLNDVTIYDPVTNKWSVMTALPQIRHSISATVVSGKIVAVGGYYNGLNQQTWVGTVG
jgi:N-acetylneuraminic acid mutarotase